MQKWPTNRKHGANVHSGKVPLIFHNETIQKNGPKRGVCNFVVWRFWKKSNFLAESPKKIAKKMAEWERKLSKKKRVNHPPKKYPGISRWVVENPWGALGGVHCQADLFAASTKPNHTM